MDQLVEYVAAIDVGRHGPGRVMQPRPTPGGPEGTWNVGRAALRQALSSGRTPSGSFWAVTDGYVGTALAFGASREGALRAWRAENERVRPQPPPPVDPSALLPEASWEPREWSPDQPPEPLLRAMFVSRGWDAPSHDPSPDATPAAVVRLPALPAAKVASGSWTRWLGDRGTTHFALRLPMRDGFALVGDGLLSRFNLETLDGQLDAVEAAHGGGEGASRLLRQLGGPRPTHTTVRYRCADLATGVPVDPRVDSRHWGAGLDASGFDGASLRSFIVRVRKLEPDELATPAVILAVELQEH